MTLKNLYKKCTAKPYSFLVIDGTLASDNLSLFSENLLERIKKLIMIIQFMIRLKMKKQNISSQISALSSAEIDKYEYLTDEEILPSN